MEILFLGVSWIFIMLGSIFVLIGAIGLVKLPDFWSRLHGASIVDSAGLILVLVGMMFYSGLTLVTLKLAIIAIFLFITGPTASHALASAAFVSGSRPMGSGHKDVSEDANLSEAATQSREQKQ